MKSRKIHRSRDIYTIPMTSYDGLTTKFSVLRTGACAETITSPRGSGTSGRLSEIESGSFYHVTNMVSCDKCDVI